MASPGTFRRRKPTPRQLALAADIIKRYINNADLTSTDKTTFSNVANDLGIAALAEDARRV